jgi:hypothetical protein
MQALGQPGAAGVDADQRRTALGNPGKPGGDGRFQDGVDRFGIGRVKRRSRVSRRRWSL